LASLSLAHEDGAFIGAEDDLLSRLGVSRPTLRQAAKIAENDRLISVRRGAKGGFYAVRPNAEDAIRTLARFLRLTGATLSDVLAVGRLVSEEAAALACGCTDAALRDRLGGFEARIDAHDTPPSLIASEAELAEIMAAMSANPAIGVVMAISYSFGMAEQRIGFYRSSEHRRVARKLQRQLCAAILDRDVEVARALMRARAATYQRWIAEAQVA
jgi:DNA-binding FadR family transcriptional regulator